MVYPLQLLGDYPKMLGSYADIFSKNRRYPVTAGDIGTALNKLLPPDHKMAEHWLDTQYMTLDSNGWWEVQKASKTLPWQTTWSDCDDQARLVWANLSAFLQIQAAFVVDYSGAHSYNIAFSVQEWDDEKDEAKELLAIILEPNGFNFIPGLGGLYQLREGLILI